MHEDLVWVGSRAFFCGVLVHEDKQWFCEVLMRPSSTG